MIEAKLDWKELPTPLDLVFLDGCHAFDYVNRDTRNSIRHLKEGGLLIWHDYGMIRDVSKVVDETAKKIKSRRLEEPG